MWLQPQDKKAFFTEGYFLAHSLFTLEEVGRMKAAFERLRERARRITSSEMVDGSWFVVERQRIDRVVWCGAAEPELLALGRDDRILSAAAALLGSPRMEHLVCQAHFKIPGDEVHFPWHQDSEHRRYGTDLWTDVNGQGSYVQTIIAVDPMTTANGPLKVVPFSCGRGHLGLNRGNVAPDLEESAAIITMNPGDAVFMHPYTVHGSEPNQSEQPRRIFINGFSFPGSNRRIYPGEGAGGEVIYSPTRG